MAGKAALWAGLLTLSVQLPLDPDGPVQLRGCRLKASDLIKDSHRAITHGAPLPAGGWLPTQVGTAPQPLFNFLPVKPLREQSQHHHHHLLHLYCLLSASSVIRTPSTYVPHCLQLVVTVIFVIVQVTKLGFRSEVTTTIAALTAICPCSSSGCQKGPPFRSCQASRHLTSRLPPGRPAARCGIPTLLFPTLLL